MSEETYARLEERYESRPPFVFFFNPTIQLQQYRLLDGYYVGYEIKRDDKWVSIDYKTF